jgi:hypothetical protein
MEKKHYNGRSNASGAVALGSQHFIVADDEQNELSIFIKDQNEPLEPSLALKEIFNGEISDDKHREIDLEGATLIGDVYFWIGSHSTNKDSEPCSDRHRLFAMHIQKNEQGGYTAHRCGSIYTQLIADLNRDQRFNRYKLNIAETIAPKAIGGLSIEGLASTPNKELLIGFRNPLVGGVNENNRLTHGKAFLVLLKNPLAVIQGQAAQFGDPVELDLGGLGIRDIVLRKNHQYLIVAGPYHDNKINPEQTKLYLWDGDSKDLEVLNSINLEGLNIEAAFFYPGQDDFVQLLSDDGKNRGFTSLWVKL